MSAQGEYIERALVTVGRVSGRPEEKRRYSTSEERREAFADLCHHLSQGFTLDSWEGGSYPMILEYLDLYPEEWDRDLFEQAKRVGRKNLEAVGLNGMLGKLGKGAWQAAWFSWMRNRYGWRNEPEPEVAVRKDADSGVVIVPGQIGVEEWSEYMRATLEKQNVEAKKERDSAG
jgi:hypothetical protein